jgi:hypothetical protein
MKQKTGSSAKTPKYRLQSIGSSSTMHCIAEDSTSLFARYFGVSSGREYVDTA